MKPFLISLFLFFTFLNLYPQEQHSYGPVKDQNWYTYAYSASSGSGPHSIGDNAGGGEVVTYICFVNWQWNEMNIPSEATLTSINIKFRAQTNNYSQRNLDFTLHWIPEDWSTIDFDPYAHDIYYNDNRLVFEDSKNSNTSGYVSYEQTVTSGNWFNAIQDAITNSNHYMTLAVRCENEGYPFWDIYGYDGSSTYSPSIGITFNYTTPTQNYTFFNKFGNTEDYGDLVFNNDYQNPFPSGTTKHPSWGSSNTIRTDELPFDYNWNQSGTTQKHLFWHQDGDQDNKYVLNNDFQAGSTIPVTMKANFDATAKVNVVNNIEGMVGGQGDINFIDPFYYYEDNYIWHQSEEPKTYSSPFTTYNNSGNSYGGVFLGQDPTFDDNIPNYSLQAINSLNIPVGGAIGTREFYFQKWTADPSNGASFESATSITTGVVFNSTNATVYANLHGQGLSNTSDCISTPSQRKIVRTADGRLHRVYESMDHVWYEMSGDNGQSWTLMNDGEPLDNGKGENPSIAGVRIDDAYDYVVVVFQQNEGGIAGFDYSVQLNVFGGLIPNNPLSLYQKLQTATIYSSGYQYTHTEATPVVAIRPAVNTSQVEVVWHQNEGLFIQDGGLSYLTPPYNPVESIYKVPNTTNISINPSIATHIQNNTPGYFYLVWEENNIIKYIDFHSRIFSQIISISNFDGYTYDNTPSLIALDDNLARICWKGTRFVSQIDPDTKTDNSYWDIRTIFKGINSNRYWYFGNNVSSPNINKADGQTYYGVIWNQNENSTYFADNSLSTIRQISGLPGSAVSLSNGPTSSDMYADIFNTASVPYYLKTSNSLNSYYIPQKPTTYYFASGREGTIIKDSAQFYFALGDIIVDDQAIDFVEIPDSIIFNSNEVLNTWLISEGFQLTNNSSFQYSIQYGIGDSSSAAASLANLNSYVNFKLQLVDVQTSEIIGTYDEVTFDQSNIYQYSSLSYQVNTSGIGNRTVYLRLVTDDNINAGYSLGEIYASGNVLGKATVKTKNFDGLTSITRYTLSQNFPNPFNPSTTINYQLPQNGFVTLKIYDVLGKEVTTLVNEQKNQGRYTVNFDASRLATGVYIYQIRVNDYISSKKMLLLK